MISILNCSNGQRLSYSQTGDPSGYPVLIQHGMVASIGNVRLFHILSQAGARIISIARPGYGGSSPYEMKNVAEWGQIVAGLVAELGLEKFGVLGISSGATYAYAIAHALPTQVSSVFILSGIPALYDDRVAAHWPYPVDRSASLAQMQDLAYDLFFAHLSPPEREQPDAADSLANNCFGPGLDLCIRGRDWGFRLEEIQTPVLMRHSQADNFAAAQATAALLPNCRLDIRENDEHFSPEVLDRFIEEIILPRLGSES